MLYVVEASILLQLTAAALALRLIPLTRHRLAWGLWCTALLLMALRRAVSLSAMTADELRGSELGEELIALTISALLVVGMYMLGPLFRSMRAAQQVLSEQLEERHRMARQLHDTLGQSFAGVLMQLEAANACEGDAELARAHRERARRTAQSGLHEARDGMLFLKQPDLARGELIDALERFIVQVRRDYEQEILFQSDGTMPDLEPLVASECFRIVQEAVINSARHAESGRIEVQTKVRGRERQFSVRDFGVGMEDPTGPRAGFGLATMKERAERIGAQLTLQSSPDSGTCVELSLRV